MVSVSAPVPLSKRNHRAWRCSGRNVLQCLPKILLALGLTGMVWSSRPWIITRPYADSWTEIKSTGTVDSVPAQISQLDGVDIPPRKNTPTHTACQNASGIYHIFMGDIGGAAGTIFYQFVIAQILYAERSQLIPWIHFTNVSHIIYDPIVHNPTTDTTTNNNNGNSLLYGVHVTAMTGRNATYKKRPRGFHRDRTPGPPDPSQPIRQQTMYFPGTGVWEHYFEPISDFVPGDQSCTTKLYVTMDLYLITPGLHGYADYAPRCWRYKYMPDYMTKPHLGITEWLEPQRKVAHRVVQQYIRPRSYLQLAAQRVNPDCSSLHPCLGLHIRHSDKAAGRRVVATAEFLPYAMAFVKSVANIQGTKRYSHIYLATDSSVVLDEIRTTWPKDIGSIVRTAGDNVLRSNNDVAVFDMNGASQHHRTNQEVLVEILSLSSCQFLVHGFSAVSEAAVWSGLHLHNQSVNLEDPDRLTDLQFEQLVQMVLTDSPMEQWPRPIGSVDVWPELYNTDLGTASNNRVLSPSGTACQGYNGILHISSVGRGSGAGAGFFTSILNQLLFADKYNLKPWVHLRAPGSSNSDLYDEKVHSKGGRIVFEMKKGMAVSLARLDEANATTIYPGEPKMVSEALSAYSFSVEGNGIWNSYFEPVSDFVPGDESCRSMPLIEISVGRHLNGFELYAPWSIRAWRYDGVPDQLWWDPGTDISLLDWYWPMRERASQIVGKYYRFRPFIVKRADQINPVAPGTACLGIHLRNGDKFGAYRTKIKPKLFEDYIDAFVRAGGTCVFVATDSHRALRYLYNSLPERLTKVIRSQGDKVVRSTKLDWPAHYLEDHHRVNSEVLVDILALSKCHILLHGFSTVSEAAIYLNPKLHNNSFNLEDPKRTSLAVFENTVKRVIASVLE